MLIRKLLRTALKYKAQFISMIIMIAIGVGVFIGFHIEWYSIEKNTNSFYDETSYADYRIYDEKGFSEIDIKKLKEIEGLNASRVLAVSVNVKGSSSKLSLFVTENTSVSSFLTTSGAKYDQTEEGFWLSDKFASANSIKVGDELTIIYRNILVTGKVLGLGKSSEYTICVADENQLMPDYQQFGFIYATPKLIFDALGFTYYPQINLISKMSKAKIEKALADILEKNILVTDKNEHYSYAGPKSEIEEGKTIGSILPVLFLLIAVLTMVTTMHRISANERTQIGILKSLGFRNRKILIHYTSYGLFLGAVGSLLGIILGFVIARIIINPKKMMGVYLDLPSWNLYMPLFCWLIIILVIAFMTLISYLSVKNILKETAAETLKAATPKKVKKLKIEKTKFWAKLSFGTRWNLRDLARQKVRSIMTIIGVMGCVILLVGGFGMKDTMDAFLYLIDDKIYNYNTRINITENASNEEVLDFARTINGDTLASSSIKIGDKPVTLEIYNNSHDLVRFIDEESRLVKLTDDGVYICLRLAKDYGVGDIIEISPYGSSKSYQVKVAGVIRSVINENIVMTEDYAKKIEIPYHISAVFTSKVQNEIVSTSYIASIQTKEDITSSYDSFMEILNIMVIIFVLGATVLGSVVLYNLGVMSYLERTCELATLKIIGFRDKKIGKILISQNMWLTIVGIIIGLPSGVLILQLIIISLAKEYELKLVVGALTYLVSIVLTLGVSLIVGIFVARKNKKIDMVEALKGAE